MVWIEVWLPPPFSSDTLIVGLWRPYLTMCADCALIADCLPVAAFTPLYGEELNELLFFCRNIRTWKLYRVWNSLFLYCSFNNNISTCFKTKIYIVYQLIMVLSPKKVNNALAYELCLIQSNNYWEWDNLCSPNFVICSCVVSNKFRHCNWDLRLASSTIKRNK